MIAATLTLLLSITVVLCFKNALVVVLEDNEYVPALSARGASVEFHYGSMSSSLVHSLANLQVDWKAYVADFDPSNSGHLISFSDLSDEFSHIDDESNMEDDFKSNKFPTFGFYFPKKAQGNNPNWLRRFIAPKLDDPQFMKNTLIIILYGNSNLKSTTSALLLGNSNKRDNHLLEKLQESGFILRDTTTPVKFPWFEKILIVVLENQPLKITMNDTNFQALAAKGTLLRAYNALINPSQPNYIMMVAGDNLNVTTNDAINLTARCIVDLLEEKGISWKTYQEDYPGNCFAGATTTDNKYKRKHNPFISFNQIRNNETLCAKIVNAQQFNVDVAANAVPQYSFYTPNMDNDGHDTGVGYAGEWVTDFLAPLFTNQEFMKNQLIVVTFDEGIKPDNTIYTLFLGNMVPAGYLDDTYYTHYSLLKWIEQQFSLSSLGRHDVNASVIDPSQFYLPGKPTEAPTPSPAPEQQEPQSYTAVAVIGALVLVAIIGGVAYMLIRRNAAQKSKNKFSKLEQAEFLEPLADE